MEKNHEEVVEQDVQETEKVVEETQPEVENDHSADAPEVDHEAEEKVCKLKEREEELFRREVNLTLQEHGLEQFADVIQVKDTEELKATINKLKKITNEIKASAGYVPKENAKADAYTEAQTKGDTKGMIKSLFSRL